MNPLAAARDLTSDEVQFFRTHGWVKLDRLIAPELARQLLTRAKALMGENADATTGAGGGVEDPAFADYKDVLRNHLGAWRSDPLMHELSHSPGIGRVASRLLRNAPVRFFNDEILVKPPVAQGGKPTPWHQDFPHTVFDRSGLINIWIALVDLPPERGAMRFMSGSHRAGPIGRTLLQKEDALEQHPFLLQDYEMSAPLHLKPGDATVHGDLTVHGGPANQSNGARWAYLINIVDARVRYNGAPSYGEQDLTALRPNDLLPDRRYPIVFRGA